MSYTAGYRRGMLHGLLIGGIVAWFCAFAFGQTPASELRAAATDIKTVTDDPSHYRYLTTYNLPDPKQPADVSRFWVNCLSTRSTIRLPERVTDTLWRVDRTHYNWSRDAWESIVTPDGKRRLEPYFARESFDDETLKAEYNLRALTSSSCAIVRLDYFVAVTSLEPAYSKFLQLPPTLAELEAAFHVDRKGVQKFGLAQGGAVLQSIVALHNRQLERWPTLTGYWWQSRDARSNAGIQNVLENVFAIQHEAGEFIFSLPNKLQAYYLANAAGTQQKEVPPDIAIDSRTTLKDKRVRNALNCVGCHDVGINGFEDVIAKMLPKPDTDDTGATYGLYDKKLQLAFEEFYRSDLGQRIAADNEQYAAAVLTCNGLTPEANAAAFGQLVATYLEGRVSLEVALRELGTTQDKLLSVVGRKELVLDPHKLYLGSINALLAGETIGRDLWAQDFWKVARALLK